MSCQGSLKIFGSTGKSINELNRGHTGFTVRSNEVSTFIIATKPNRPYLVFSPWLGVQHKLFPEHYKNELAIEVATDEETYFNTKITARRSGIVRFLNCSIHVDDAYTASSDPNSSSSVKRSGKEQSKLTKASKRMQIDPPKSW